MRLSEARLTVVGGGIGGLAAALALARRGAEVTVLERARSLKAAGAGIQISPNGAAVLRMLGLGARLDAAGRATAVVLHEHRAGRRVVRLDLAGSAYHFLHRGDLVAMLAEAAREAGVDIRCGREVTAVEPGGDAPRLRMAGGTAETAGLLVCADGLRSVGRTALDGPAAARFTGQAAWRAVIPAEGPVPAEARVFMGPGRHLVTYPLRDGAEINLVAVEERRDWTAEGWRQTDDPAHLRAAFAGFAPEVQALLARVETPGLWGLFRHPVAARWHGGGAVLLGDAAHPTLPFLAQGANMALEDAWVLAACLARAGNARAGLAAYQAARRPRCRRIVAAADRNARLYHLRPGPVREVAHAVLGGVGAVAPRAMLGGFDWLYGHDVTRTHP